MAVEADDVNALSHVYNLGVSAGSSPKPYLAVSSARVVELYNEQGASMAPMSKEMLFFAVRLPLFYSIRTFHLLCLI